MAPAYTLTATLGRKLDAPPEPVVVYEKRAVGTAEVGEEIE